MSDLLGWILPLLVLMLCPIWLPMLGWLGGNLRDLVAGHRDSSRPVEHRPVRERRPDHVIAVEPEEA